jgi:hypothetical protein
MASPAPREPTAPLESVLGALAQLDADPKLEGKGLSVAFARSFPDLPAEGFALAATEVARVATVLGVPGIVVRLILPEHEQSQTDITRNVSKYTRCVVWTPIVRKRSD